MSNGDSSRHVTVQFSNVTVTFGHHTVLDHVSFDVPEGGCTAVVGPNGAGKTTVLLSLLGQVHYQGQIQIGCRCGEHGPPRIGYVPQRFTFDEGMPLTVLEFMVMGQQRMPLWFGISPKYRAKALELLSSVQAEFLAERKLGDLSGGEVQRVLLALALGQDPDLLILDEPSAGVDLQGGYVFCELLEALRGQRGFTQLMVSHDLATVIHHATHVVGLNRIVLAEGRPREVLTAETLTSIFGLHMGLVDSRLMQSTVCSATRSKEEGHV